MRSWLISSQIYVVQAEVVQRWRIVVDLDVVYLVQRFLERQSSRFENSVYTGSTYRNVEQIRQRVEHDLNVAPLA